MFGKRKSLKERSKVRKTREGKWRYYRISLQDDLANLIGAGLQRAGINQKALGDESYLGESRVSRLANAAINCKLGTVVQALLPLGVVPMIVDKAEWDTLRDKAELTERSQGWPKAQSATIVMGATNGREERGVSN